MKVLTPARLRIALPLLALATGLVWVALRAGPMAPVSVQTATAQARLLAPALSGSGELDVRQRERIGSRVPGRVLGVHVDVGDVVVEGQLLLELDPVDLDAKVQAQQGAVQRAQEQIALAQAQQRQAEARQAFAQAKRTRHRLLSERALVSTEALEEVEQAAQVAAADLDVARAQLGQAEAELQRVRAELAALEAQREDLRIQVLARRVDPGSTVQSGQTLLELADPADRIVLARFDQRAAAALAVGDTVEVRARSLGSILQGRVERIELVADAITEERQARISLPPDVDLPLGERVELQVATQATPVEVAVPASGLVVDAGRTGVWVVEDGRARFAVVESGLRSADGWIEIRSGLEPGASVVSYRPRPLREGQTLDVREEPRL
jgi:RND family efflux transporter MFP subunit